MDTNKVNSIQIFFILSVCFFQLLKSIFVAFVSTKSKVVLFCFLAEICLPSYIVCALEMIEGER